MSEFEKLLEAHLNRFAQRIFKQGITPNDLKVFESVVKDLISRTIEELPVCIVDVPQGPSDVPIHKHAILVDDLRKAFGIEGK